MIKRFFTDSHGKLAIIQVPNSLLLTWLLVLAITMVMGDTNLKHNLEQLNRAVLFTWAYLEIIKGSSYFRRVLGAVVMVLLILSYFSIRISIF
ncbi:MAG: hypothetical protein JWM00_470 [Candidatus Saccharibacteria bacterium]|nr:hypothetical protein [Candidatus Saccharibacteria bacterium]